MIPFARSDAVRTENNALTFGYVVERFDKDRAFPFKRFENETVMNDLMANVEGAPVIVEGSTYGLDRAIDTGAKAARFSQDNLFDGRFVRQH